MHDFPELARLLESASDRARAEILPRFRNVVVETKSDGSPVTEADRAAERAIRATLAEGTPHVRIVGEEYGGEAGEGLHWLVDPIDGTLSFSRGIPLFTTLIALVDDGEPVLGLLDLPALGERYVGWRGGGVRCNGETVRASTVGSIDDAMIAFGDRPYFEMAGEERWHERLRNELPNTRGYADSFGHALVIRGALDAMVDPYLHPWDMGPTRVLVSEAGGRCELVEHAGGAGGLVIGSPPLVDALLALRE